jgi:hypothetical protein
METNLKAATDLKNSFLERWPLDKIYSMTLEQYTGINDKNSFCQWVEHRTKPLGSIQKDSYKFGIYKHKKGATHAEGFIHDDEYSWRDIKGYQVRNRREAFALVHQQLIAIVEAALAGKFDQIDQYEILMPIFKWKIAFLYGDEQLIPIFASNLLKVVGLDLVLSRTASIWQIQQAMIDDKPAYESVYEYSERLLRSYQKNDKGKYVKTPNAPKFLTRKLMDTKNTEDYERKGSGPVVVTQRHNKLQLALRERLIAEFGSSVVFMEENYVDLCVSRPEGLYLYEVKSTGSASDCITDAMGQIFRYAYRKQEGVDNVSQLFIAGPSPLREEDVAYLEFIKQRLRFPIHYIHIEMPDGVTFKDEDQYK